MAITINIKNKDLEIKFNYQLMFKANRQLSTVDENGQRAENGAGQLFVDILERKDSAVFNLINLADARKLSEDEIVNGIAKYAEENGYETLFEEIEAEMIASDFFKPKIEKYLADMKFGKDLLGEPETKEETTQRKALDMMIDRLQNAIS